MFQLRSLKSNLFGFLHGRLPGFASAACLFLNSLQTAKATKRKTRINDSRTKTTSWVRPLYSVFFIRLRALSFSTFPESWLSSASSNPMVHRPPVFRGWFWSVKPFEVFGGLQLTCFLPAKHRNPRKNQRSCLN